MGLPAWQYARWTSLVLTILTGLWCLNGLAWAATTPIAGEYTLTSGKAVVYTSSSTFSLLQVGNTFVYSKYYSAPDRMYFENQGIVVSIFYPYNVFLKAVDAMDTNETQKAMYKQFLVSCETGGMAMVVTGALAVALLLLSIVLRLVDYCIWANEGEATSWYKYSAMLLPVLACIILVIGLFIFNTGCMGYSDPKTHAPLAQVMGLGIGPGFVLAGMSAAFVFIYAGLNCFAIIKGRDSKVYDRQDDGVALGAIGSDTTTTTIPVKEQAADQATTKNDAKEHNTANDTIGAGAYEDAGDAPMFSGLTLSLIHI